METGGGGATGKVSGVSAHRQKDWLWPPPREARTQEQWPRLPSGPPFPASESPSRHISAMRLLRSLSRSATGRIQTNTISLAESAGLPIRNATTLAPEGPVPSASNHSAWVFVS